MVWCSQETQFSFKDTYRLKVKEWENIFHTNGNKKRAEVAIHLSDKVDFKQKILTRDKEGHYIITKGSIHQEDITVINIYDQST